MSQSIQLSSPASSHFHQVCFIKTTSLQHSSRQSEPQSHSPSPNQQQVTIIKSEQRIKHQKHKQKYQSILELQFCDNNFGKIIPNPQKLSISHETHKSYSLTLRNLPRKTHKISNIIAMLKSQYPVVHNLIHKYFNYKLYNKEDHFSQIYLLWVDTYVSEEFIKRLKSYQKINHFPNSCQLGRKDLLTHNLKHAHSILPQEYNFYPKAWVLPKQLQSFQEQQPKDKFLIVKPHANCQGRGIYLTKNPQFSHKDEVIVQQYIHNPMLLDGCKFDLRIYVLLRSLTPLRIYVYRQGLCRLATSKYVEPNQMNIGNDKMHLTNYAINKFNPNFIGNKEIQSDHKGHKRSYTSVIKHLASNGFDTNKIQERIESVIVRTILAGYNKLLSSYKKTREQSNQYSPPKEQHNNEEPAISRNINQLNNEEPSVCFQLLGFDIMLLNSGEPILLEVNHQPSLVTDSPLDHTVKRSLVMDTINILNIDQKDKDQWLRCQKQGLPFKSKPTEQQQQQNIGGFKLIFPVTPSLHPTQSKQQSERLDNTRLFYQIIMNKFLFNEFRKNKIKISNYKTISSRIENRSHHNNHSPQSSDRTRFNKNNLQTQQKAIALTFYNLFNDSKYLIKRENANESKDESFQDDSIIKNHIYLAEIEDDFKTPPYSYSTKKYSKNSIQSTPSPLKIKSKKNDSLLQLQQTEKGKKISPEQISLTTLLSNQKLRQNLASIRNRGIFSYISSHRSKRKHKNNEEHSNQLEKHNKKNRSTDCKQQRLVKQQQRQMEESPIKINSENWKQLVITPNTLQISQKQTTPLKDKVKELKTLYYTNLARQRPQNSNNIKSIRSQYQRLNFASFLSKQKLNKPQIIDEQLCIDTKQTSPSAQ